LEPERPNKVGFPSLERDDPLTSVLPVLSGASTAFTVVLASELTRVLADHTAQQYITLNCSSPRPPFRAAAAAAAPPASAAANGDVAAVITRREHSPPENTAATVFSRGGRAAVREREQC